MNAAIVTIGDEILYGQILNTNSAWLAERLSRQGVRVGLQLTVPDSSSSIRSAIEGLIGHFELIILTGGLGPTGDDRTKPALRSVFGGKLETSEKQLQIVEELFRARGKDITETNRQQANVPSSCVVLPNENGTAPGMLFRKNSTSLYAFPGVPFEMKALAEKYLFPKLASDTSISVLHNHFGVFGIAESELSDMLTGFEESLPEYLSLAYLPSPSGIRLRLTANFEPTFGLHKMKRILQDYSGMLKKLLGCYLYTTTREELPEVVARILKEKAKTVATAESCTGGTVARLLTAIPGASEYFTGGIVAYSNQAKEQLLGVSSEIIEQHGAVSRETVEAMAVKAKKRFSSDYSVAISGIAGPTGGTPEKPVGTVWIAVATPKNLHSKQFRFGKIREVNIQRSAYNALNMLRLLIG